MLPKSFNWVFKILSQRFAIAKTRFEGKRHLGWQEKFRLVMGAMALTM